MGKPILPPMREACSPSVPAAFLPAARMTPSRVMPCTPTLYEQTCAMSVQPRTAARHGLCGMSSPMIATVPSARRPSTYMSPASTLTTS